MQLEFGDKSFYSSVVVISCILGHEWETPDTKFLLHSHLGAWENVKQKMLGSSDLGRISSFHFTREHQLNLIKAFQTALAFYFLVQTSQDGRRHPTGTDTKIGRVDTNHNRKQMLLKQRTG